MWDTYVRRVAGRNARRYLPMPITAQRDNTDRKPLTDSLSQRKLYSFILFVNQINCLTHSP